MTTTEGGAAPTSVAELLQPIRDALQAPGSAYEVVEEDVRGEPMPVFRHRARSLRELLEGSARFAGRPYLVDGATRLDFAGHLRRVDALAAALQHEHGVQPGDRVAILAANRWEWVVAFWAATSAGGVPCAFNSYWTTDEIAHATALTEPVVVLADADRLARMDDVADEVRRVSIDDDLPGLLEAHDGRRPDAVAVDEDEPADLIFPSGTTGRPKAVTATHRSVVGFVQLNTFNEAVGAVAGGGSVPPPGAPVPTSDEVVLATSPLFHTSMLYGAVVTAVVKGCEVVLLPGRFDPERVLEAIDRERVTLWMALGSAAPRVSACPTLDRYDTSSVRMLGVGGATVSPAVQQRLREAFPSTSGMLGMGYTSTEAAAVVANIGGPDFQARPTSTGRATPTTRIELRDELGRPVADGELGEVHVRSPYLMLGYWRDPDATAAALKPGGWLAMGDMARLDDGWLHIDARARDMILVSAENVSPTEVEYRLDEHPGVVEAAVLAVDAPLTGAPVCAVVVVGPDGPPAGEEGEGWCRGALAHYKVPTRWHLTDEPLPRTPSGKLLKHRIRTEIVEGTA